MALKKYYSGSKKRSGDSGVVPDRGLLSKEQRDQRISLFLQDFDQQAKEHLRAMKQDLESLLQTAEKAFRVELLTRPVVMRRMRRKELLNLKEDEAAATVVAAAMVTDCSVGEGATPKLVRSGSKRVNRKPNTVCLMTLCEMLLLVKVTTIVEYEDSDRESGLQGKKTSQKIFKTKSLASLTSSFKGKQSTSRSACSTPNARNPEKPCKLERSASAPKCTPVGSKRLPQRVLSNSASAPDRTCGPTLRSVSMPHKKAVPFVNIPLADGQTLCSANSDLQNINVDLLNDDTVRHIHTLVNQLTVLCGKTTVKPS
ncbi:borealin-2-like isoform X1 [Heteronotia binoei]|uniref:borealin-2-like isoform X1 n=1 Tax=Heteronotia binoei TaxID=13085 RepID=UPI00292E3B48|nr:borealin-2-like isoform X1 [Heteronotia binoei]